MSVLWEPPDTPNMRPSIPPKHLLFMILVTIGIWALGIYTAVELFGN